MGINRLSTNSIISQSSFWLQRNQNQLNRLQEKAALGQNISRASDDPLGLTQVLGMTRGLNQNEQYSKNIQLGISEVKAADIALTQAVDVVQRATELATQGATITTNASSMQALGREVDQLINQLVQLGNVSINDKFLFAGVRTTTPPFSRSGDVVTYSGTPNTQAWERQVDVTDNTKLTINLAGDSVFGNTTTANTLFRVMVDLKNNLLAGDQTNTRLRLDELKAQQETVLSAQSQLGAVQTQLEETEERQSTYNNALSQRYATLQNVDMPKLISDLRFQEQVNQASLSVMGRVVPRSLMDFLQ